MMSWAEAAGRAEGITRQAADEWALRSHQRACAAMNDGKFDEEIGAGARLGAEGTEVPFQPG